MKRFDFQLEDIEKRVSSGICGDWRELQLIVHEIIKLKEEINKLKKRTKKVIENE